MNKMLSIFGISFILIYAFTVFSFSGCSKGEDPVFLEVTPSPTPVITTPKPTKTPEPTPSIPEGMGVNPLTGLYINEEAVNRRPVAIVINNMIKALPQSGIGQADMYYEILSEANITRIIAIFKDFSSEKIGPVRSARDYFLFFALDNDAIFAHHGGSDQGSLGGAYAAIKKFKIDNIDGMKHDGTIFQRDKKRINTPGMYEHSSYAGAERLLDYSEKTGFRIETDFEPLFKFYDKLTDLGGEKALRVNIPFSDSQDAHFIMDEETKSYTRFEYGSEQIDEETGERLKVENIIIQYANIWLVKGDAYGRRAAELTGKGDGVLVSNGSYIPIKWEKESYEKPTKWTDENGKQLTLNKGKTWICVIDPGKTATFLPLEKEE